MDLLVSTSSVYGLQVIRNKGRGGHIFPQGNVAVMWRAAILDHLKLANELAILI